MITQLDRKQQRFLAIALFVVAFVVVTSAIIVPVWSTIASNRQSIVQLQDRLQTLRRVAASDGKLRPRYEQVRAAQLAAGHYIKSTTEAVAAAELQRVLKVLAGENGARVLSTQILPANQEEEFVRIALRARLRGTLPGFVDTVYAIETYDIFLFLDNVSLSNSADRRRVVQKSTPQFEVNLDLVTYLPGEP